MSALSREENHALISGVANNSIAKAVAAHSRRTIQRGVISTDFAGTATGSGIIAELGDVVAARVEHLDAVAVLVCDEDATGSDVRSHAHWRLEDEVARSDRATEMADLYSHVTQHGD